MLQDLLELEGRISAWLRPTYRGALFIFGMSLGWSGKLFMLTILVTLVLLAGVERGVVLFVVFLGVGVGAGAVAGTVYGILHPLERWGQLGTWLRWTAVILGCIVAVALLTPQGPLSLDPTFLVLAFGLSAAGAGCLILLDDRSPTRPSLRRFRLRQSRDRLWAAAAQVRARFHKTAFPSHGVIGTRG